MRQCGAHEVDASRYQIMTPYKPLRLVAIRLPAYLILVRQIPPLLHSY